MGLILLDNSILWSILAICFGGLGFVTYNHPSIGREILRYSMVAVLLFFICHWCFIRGVRANRDYSTLEMQLHWGRDIMDYTTPEINIDSLEGIYKSKPDTLLYVIKQLKIANEKREQQRNLKQAMLLSLIKANNDGTTIYIDEMNRVSVFYQIALWGMAALFLVSYFFKDDRKPVTNEKDQPADKSAEQKI